VTDASTPEPPPLPASVQEVLDATQAWLDGLELVYRRALALLAAEGVQEIRAQGRPFDPHLHVAVETALTDDVPPNTVVDVTRKGYRQHGKVLRYAEVVVSQSKDKGHEIQNEQLG
jgi:molecular chaperone GrpE